MEVKPALATNSNTDLLKDLTGLVTSLVSSFTSRTQNDSLTIGLAKLIQVIETSGNNSLALGQKMLFYARLTTFFSLSSFLTILLYYIVRG